MIKLLLFWILSLVITTSSFVSSIGQSKAAFIQQPNENIFNSKDTSYRIIPAPDNTYGYEIVIKNKVFIRQLNIPGKAGIQGFRNKIDAEKVAQLVLKKLSKGVMPPTIEEAEMIKLKIKF